MKLSNYGLPDKLLIWLNSFLQGRMMKVQVNGSSSSWVHVLSGVPQRSVLGPLLFLLYVNDLPDWIRSSIKMFADDTNSGLLFLFLSGMITRSYRTISEH